MILSTAYLPPVSWLVAPKQINKMAPALPGPFPVYLEQHEHYQKGTYRNRCDIGGPNGVQTLSVPLRQGKNSRMPIRAVEIAYNEPWQRNHLRSIEAAYGSAPLFEHYYPQLAANYENQPRFLFDWNLILIEWLLKRLQANYTILLTEQYLPDYPDPATDLRATLSPKLPVPEWIALAPYPQVFEDRYGFRGNLSGLDLLFCGAKNL